MDKVNLVIVASVIGLFLGASVGLAGASQVGTVAPHRTTQVSTDDLGAVEVTLPSSTTLPVTVISVSPAKHVTQAPVARTYTCNAPHTMAQGPIGALVKDCAWR